jgi:hypothetical protein
MGEVYVSIDVETDGPIPGPHSMLSFGAAAFLGTGEMLGTFTRNLELLPDAQPHPDTAKFWAQNREAYEATRTGPISPDAAMRAFDAWLRDFETTRKLKPVCVAYPAGFDFMFVYWYLIRFVGRSAFSFSALDMKSYAMAKLGTSFRGTAKRTMPRSWFTNRPHTHVALDDAIEQGELFIAMLRADAATLSRAGEGRPAGPG